MTREQIEELKRVVLENVKIDRRRRDPCWLWQGRVHPVGGHALLFYQGHEWRAQRLVVRLWHLGGEPIPGRLIVHHDCHNPACLNPDHLRLMTPGAHQRLHRLMEDRWGQKHPLAKWTPADVQRVRRLRAQGVPMKEIAAETKIPERTCYYMTTGGGWRSVSRSA